MRLWYVSVYCLLLIIAVQRGTEAKKNTLFSCHFRSYMISFFHLVLLIQFLLWSLTVCLSWSLVFFIDTRGAGG